MQDGTALAGRGPRSCVTCGEEFTPGTRGPIPKTCRTCANAVALAQTRAQDARRAAERDAAPRSCGQCGERLFRRVQNGPWPTFCQPCSARRRYLRTKARQDAQSVAYEAQRHVCTLCGVEVARPHKAGHFPRHCPTCLPLWKKANQAAAHQRRKPPRICLVCEQPFELPGGMLWRKRCSPCHDQFRIELSHDKNGRRRARLREVDYEKFSSLTVFERCEWICALCGGPVDRTLLWPDGGMPSLDHIVPVARGGPHTESNSQLAHLRCNIAKGDALAA